MYSSRRDNPVRLTPLLPLVNNSVVDPRLHVFIFIAMPFVCCAGCFIVLLVFCAVKSSVELKNSESKPLYLKTEVLYLKPKSLRIAKMSIDTTLNIAIVQCVPTVSPLASNLITMRRNKNWMLYGY